MSDFSRIPIELRAWPQWIVWRYEDGGGKQTKVPYDAKTGYLASVTDPHTWADFETAVRSSSNFSGIGFVLSDRDPFSFIDLDATDKEDFIRHQSEIYSAFDSYSERSPSGKGLHVICKGSVPSGRRRNSVELYSSDRYMTVTGDVFADKPIAERQSLLHALWQDMGKVNGIVINFDDQPETKTDREIFESAANAANGEKFKALWNGQWGDLGYPSQSEADFALIDIVGFYTQNKAQIERLFLTSWLGQRKKAQRKDYVSSMINRSFDRMFPQVEFDQLREAMAINFGEQKRTAPGPLSGAVPTAVSLSEGIIERAAADPLEQTVSTVKLPAGLIADIARYVFAQAPRPVPEIALMAAVGLMAGICGRAYNTPTGAGLNLYTCVIGLTAVGKEQMASGIAKLMQAVHDKVPAANEFIGPSEIRSDAALLRILERQPCMVSIIGEFGLKLHAMCSPNANTHQTGLKSVLLDLYGKSGRGNILRRMVYSDSSKNTRDIHAPAFSILAESTPSTFYPNVDESIIAQGLLPRFLTVEYYGDRPELNDRANLAIPPDLLVNQLMQLTAHCHTLMNKGIVINVQYDADSRHLSELFDKFCDRQINSTKRDVIRDLWNRAHLKSLKLASLVGIGVNPHNPIIDRESWLWAQSICERDVNNLVQRFETGDVGKDTEENKQSDDVLRVMKEWIMKPWEDVSKYAPDMVKQHADKVIPYQFIQRRLVAVSSFRKDRIGATNAIKRTLQTLIDGGQIAEIDKRQIQQRYGNSLKCYAIVGIEAARAVH